MKTALYEKHKALGAKFVNFGEWEMPLQYKSVIHEHQSVRNQVGIFDISHMGRILVEGPDAERFLDYLSTNRITLKPNGSATYTVWCHSNGYSVDDVIIYRQDSHHYFVIVNASNRQKDLEHLKLYFKGFNVSISDCYGTEAILALQGPNALQMISQLFPECSLLKKMHFIEVLYQNQKIIVSATGYTGEKGVEIIGPKELLTQLWDELLLLGKPFGIEPIGLAARDTLRLEKGYALYGHEISDTIAPTESVSAWSVKMDKSNFLGKEALDELQNNPKKRFEYGIILLDLGIARENYEVFKEGIPIGKVTSGNYSPTLEKSIAIVLVDQALDEGETLEVKIRNKLCKAQVVKLPFVS